MSRKRFECWLFFAMGTQPRPVAALRRNRVGSSARCRSDCVDLARSVKRREVSVPLLRPLESITWREAIVVAPRVEYN